MEDSVEPWKKEDGASSVDAQVEHPVPLVRSGLLSSKVETAKHPLLSIVNDAQQRIGPVTLLALHDVGDAVPIETLGPLDALVRLDLSHNRLEAFPHLWSFNFEFSTPSVAAQLSAEHGVSRPPRTPDKRSESIGGGDMHTVLNAATQTLWSLDLSNNQLSALPHIAAYLPILGYVNLQGNPNLDPSTIVRALRGLICAEVVVPLEVSREVLVDSMLGVLCVNGQMLPPPSLEHHRACELYSMQLARRFPHSPFADLLNALHHARSLEGPSIVRAFLCRALVFREQVGVRNTAPQAAAVQLFVASQVCPFEKCSETDLPLSFNRWRWLLTEVHKTTLAQHVVSAGAVGLLPLAAVRQWFVTLADDVPEGPECYDRRVEILAAAESAMSWPMYVAERLIESMQVPAPAIKRREDVDVLQIDRELKPRVMLPESFLDVVEAKKAQMMSDASRVEEMRQYAQATADESRRQAALRQVLFVKASQSSRVATPAGRSSTLSASQTDVVPAEGERDSEVVDEPSASEFVVHNAMNMPKCKWLELRPPLVYAGQRRAESSPSQPSKHRPPRVGDEVRFLSPTGEPSEGVYFVRRVLENGLVFEVVGEKEGHEFICRLHLVHALGWDPHGYWKWEISEVDPHHEERPVSKQHVRRPVIRKSMGFVEYLKKAGLARVALSRNVSAALESNYEELATTCDPTAQRAPPAKEWLKQEPAWTREEAAHVEHFLRLPYPAVKVLEYAQQRLSERVHVTPGDSTVYRAVLGAAWAIAPECGADFNDFAAAQRCVDEYIQRKLKNSANAGTLSEEEKNHLEKTEGGAEHSDGPEITDQPPPFTQVSTEGSPSSSRATSNPSVNKIQSQRKANSARHAAVFRPSPPSVTSLPPFVAEAQREMARQRKLADERHKLVIADSNAPERRRACSATLRGMRNSVQSEQPRQFLPVPVRQVVIRDRAVAQM